MHAYSLEIMIDGTSHAKLFRAIKQFDDAIVVGTALQSLRDRTPFAVALDTPERAQILGRLLTLIDEIDRLGATYEITANNVPKSSHLWEPVKWRRLEIETAFATAQRRVEERERIAEIVANFEPPPPSPSRELFDYRWHEISFDSLLPEEQRYIMIWAMRAEVNNGGFATYFYNSSGDSAEETLSALEHIGSLEIEEILDDAVGMFDDAGGYDSDRHTRVERLNQLPNDCFIQLNTRFYEATEDVVTAAFGLVESAYVEQSML